LLVPAVWWMTTDLSWSAALVERTRDSSAPHPAREVNDGAPTSSGVAGLAAAEAAIVRVCGAGDRTASLPASAVSVEGASGSATTCSSAPVGEVVTTWA